MRQSAIIVLLLLAAGCSSVGDDPGEGCSYGGSVHPAGTGFPAGDGCNSCSCGPQGQVACTTAFCGGDGGAPVCVYGGQTYPAGASFPSTDGCNGCSCTSSGVACDARACADPCTLDATYTFGWNGGFVAYVDSSTLRANGMYSYTRTPAQSPTAVMGSCMPALPACGTDGAIDVANITADLSDADVQQSFAMAQPPLYGVDSRPNDGQVFEVKRSTGGSILVGYDCPSPTLSSCWPIPAGVAKLVADLRALNEQQLADASCASLQR